MIRTVRAALVFCLIATIGIAHAADCRSIHGTFTSVTVFPPQCTSAVGICTHGALHGDLLGSYDLTFDGFGAEPGTVSPDPGHFATSTFTAHDFIDITNDPIGTLVGSDHGSLYLNAMSSKQPFQTVVEPTAGTGAYAGMKPFNGSVIVAEGELDLNGGTTAGTYSGQIC